MSSMMKFLLCCSLSLGACVSSKVEVDHAWQKLEANRQFGDRALHECMVSDEKIIVVGGVADNTVFNIFDKRFAIYDIKNARWINIDFPDDFTDRAEFQAALIGDQWLLFFGGRNPHHQYPNHAQIYHLPSAKWFAVGGGELAGRIRHSITKIGQRALIFGGNGPESVNSWGLFDLKTKQLSSHPLPEGVRDRHSHVAVSTENGVFLWGGFEDGRKSNTGYWIDADRLEWRRIDAGVNLSARSNARAVYLDGKVYVWGGSSTDENANSGAIYHVGKDLWESMPVIPDAGFAKLKNFSLTVIGKRRILLWGGRFGNDAFSDHGWVFDTKQLRWLPWQRPHTPEPRMLHCLVRANKMLFLYGGFGVEDRDFTHYGQPWLVMIEDDEGTNM